MNTFSTVLVFRWLDFFNVAWLDINLKTKTVEKVFIEGPVPVCSKVFEKTKSCYYDELKDAFMKPDQIEKKYGKPVNFTYHGVPLKIDHHLKNHIKRY
jgi:hypothetical protein